MPVNDFPSHEPVREWLDRLCYEGIIRKEAGDHTIRNGSYYREPDRYFIQSPEILKRFTPPLVKDFISWKDKKYITTPSPRESNKPTLCLDPEISCIISPMVESVLEAGSGLGIHRDGLAELNLTAGQIQATIAATGCTNGEIIPHYEQTAGGRMYGNNPASQNIPKVVRPCLFALSGDPLVEIDYIALEPTILFLITNTRIPDIGIYEYFANESRLSRADAKQIFNPFINGQHLGHLTNSRNEACGLAIKYGERGQVIRARKKWEEWNKAGRLIENFKAMDAVLRRPEFKGVYDLIRNIRSAAKAGTPDRTVRIIASNIFFKALDSIIKDLGIPAGLPLHDGLIMETPEPGNEITAATHFKNAAEDILNYPIPAKIKRIAV